jgi:Fe-S-cluster containining protein
MPINLENLHAVADAGGFFRKIEETYFEMDRAYADAASHYGFSCSGCEDNCCLTRFFHHTAIEYAYLIFGFTRLDLDRQRLYLARADAYNAEMIRAQQEGRGFSYMCPVNDGGLCALYEFRPMICRLHGISNELAPPGRGKIFGTGCGEFEMNFGRVPYVTFDRTPFYTRMAELERVFRKQAGTTEKLKMTVAGMLLSSQKGLS